MAENRKSKGGRPSKTDDTKQSKTVRFRVTATQMENLQQRATEGKLTLSGYARQMVLTGKVIAPASPEELRLIAELLRIIRFYKLTIDRLKRKTETKQR